MPQLVKVPLIIALLLITTLSLQAQSGVWDRLGSRKVNYRLDKDVIEVGVYEGTFKKLKLVVTNGALNMHMMVIVYGYGDRDEVPMRYNFARRSSSRVIDLEGRRRVIKKIIFWYDSKNRSRRRATLTVYGGR